MAAIEGVGATVAGQTVVEETAEQVLDAENGVGPRTDGTLRQATGKADGDSGSGVGVGNGVGADAAIEDVVTGTGVEDIVECVAGEIGAAVGENTAVLDVACLLYTSPSPRDRTRSRMPSSA